MPRVTDKALIAELNDRALAARAGVDYEKIKGSSTYQNNLRNFGTGFRFNKGPGFGAKRGSFLDSLNEGILDAPIGISQAVVRGANKLDRLAGTDLVSDAEAEFAAAMPKIRELDIEDKRQQAGRGGIDIGRLAGGLTAPVKGANQVRTALGGVKGLAAQGALTGAQAAAMQPVVNDSGSFVRDKLSQATTGAIFGMGANVGLGKLAARSHQGEVPGVLEQRLDAFKRQGREASLSEAATGVPMRKVADLSSQFPGGAKLVHRAEDTIDWFHGRVADETKGSLSKTGLGDRLRGSVEGFRKSGKEQSDELYNAVTREIPMNTQFDMGKIRAGMTEGVDNFPSAPDLGAQLTNPHLQKLASSLPEKMFYNELAALRTNIGKLSTRVDGPSKMEVARVYKAIDDTMAETLANTKGAEKAQEALGKARDFYKQRQDVLRRVIEPLENQTTAEGIVNKVKSMVKDDAEGAKLLRKSLPKQDWDEVAKYVFGELGKETPAGKASSGTDISMAKFLKDFEALKTNKDAYDFAFGGERYAPMRSTFEDLSKIADSINKSKRLSNPSGTSYAGGYLGLGAMLLTNPMLPVYVWGGNTAIAHLLSNPRYARWMLKAGKIVNNGYRYGGKSAEKLMRAHVERLPAIATANGDISDGVNSLYQYFTEGAK